MSMDQKISVEFEVCLTNNGDYYIRNGMAISEIVRYVREGHYCTILGPPYCQKSRLLDDVKAQLETTGDEVCELLDLQEIDFVDDEDFLSEFTATLGARMQNQTGVGPPPSLSQVVDERSLQHFLQDYVELLNRDLVLLIDHLERVRVGPLKSLLRVLRALYIERDRDTPHRLGVVAASSLSAAALSLGPMSPFNIARVTLVRDLTPAASEKLIGCVLDQRGFKITPAAVQRCIQAVGGDRYLIPRLCSHCAELALEKQHKQVTKREIEQGIRWFVSTEAAQHPPLRETIRAIEADPVAMMNVLQVLEQGRVLRRELRLDLAAEIDDLQLTGAVRVEGMGEQQAYLIRNEVYERYLRQHFHPDRVVHVLRMAGQWDEATLYLERLLTDSPQYRSILLGAVVNSIYAARNAREACANLGRLLNQAFAIPKVRIYLVNPDRSKLELVSQAGFEEEPLTDISLQEEEHPGVRAYFSQHSVVSPGPSGERLLLIPFLRDEERPLGIAAIHDFETDPQGDDFLELLTFIKQVSRAIGYVIDRERKLLQLATLYRMANEVTSSLDLGRVLQATVEAAIEAVPAAQKGSLFLWDEKLEKLIIQAQEGFRPDIKDVMQLSAGEGYAGWVYTNQKPVWLGNVHADPRTVRTDHPDVKEEKSAIGVPLTAWGRVIGVLCLDNVTVYDAFRESDLELLSTFGAQAAIAIQNAHLYTELYELGMRINLGDLSPEQIFEKAVQSIIRVSDAKAANMLLLRDTDDPHLSVSQKPVLSVSEGLGVDFDDKIRPRPNGVTFCVLEDREPLAVSHPTDPPGINPLSLERGIQAYLCLPMTIQQSIIGVLFVHYDKPHNFSKNEIKMLSLFANQAALAIENARQREELAMTEAVAWTGIVFSSLAHRITQKAGAIRNTVWRLRQLLREQSTAVTEPLDRIEEYARIVGKIPKEVVSLSFRDRRELLNLNVILREEISRWCMPEDGIELDFSGLTDEDTSVYADPHRLAILFEILTTNAVRAMNNLSEKKLVVVSAIRDQRVVVEITNTGEIPEDVRNQLFREPIPKAQAEEGIGIGLLIARNTLRRYGGDIEPVPISSKGTTTFSLWLPLHRTTSG